MNTTQQAIRNIAVTAMSIIAIWGGYVLIKNNTAKDLTANGVTASVVSESATKSATLQQTLHTLTQVKKSSDFSFLDHTAFKSLTDFTRTVSKEPYGRDNPFAPVAGKSKSTAKTSATVGQTGSAVDPGLLP